MGDEVLVACFRHETEKDEKSYGRSGAESKKGDAIAEMIDDDASSQGADRRANSLRGRNRALREIVAAGAMHDVGDDQRCERLIDARPDPVEQLYGNQPEGVIRQGIERRADRQGRERNEKNRPAAPKSALRPTRIAIGNITPWAATMQNDIIAVASFGN